MGLLPPTSPDVTQASYCHLESRVGRSSHLRVACAGLEHCTPDYRIKRKGYVCWGLELVVQGCGELRLLDRRYRLLPGHLFLYGPGVAHVISCDPQAPMVKYFVDYYGRSQPDILSPNIIAPGEVRRTSELDAMTRIFDELIREGKKASPARPELCANYLKLLLLKSTEAGPAEAGAFSQSLSNLHRCRALIEARFSTLSGLQAVADAVHLDPRYICRLFKRFKLPTPHRYLVNCRMNRAVELLVTTSQPIKLVAAAVGYDDPLHFSRVFRQSFGCPPAEFRKIRAR